MILKCRCHSWLARPQCASAAVAMTLGLLSSWMEGWPIQLRGCFEDPSLNSSSGHFIGQVIYFANLVFQTLMKWCLSQLSSLPGESPPWMLLEMNWPGGSARNFYIRMPSGNGNFSSLQQMTTRPAFNCSNLAMPLFSTSELSLLKLQTSKTHVGWLIN